MVQPTVPIADADHESAATPTAIGRYQIIGLLGRGGMGIVLEANDPSLHRHVAIKLLNAGLWPQSSDRRERLAREAQAMARVSHPNVVVVYEVGEVGEQAFLAMEWIDGATLRDWQARPRTWREVVAMYVAAGRGLAAAHAEGLVHRDFKPENVLVGRDGRARVSDFGLVTGHGQLPASAAITSSQSIDGVAIGTPAYMSPEHWLGREVDARSDQFSFCVALWEALHRQRPFVGDTAATLRANILDGKIAPAATGALPRRLEAALRRGLASDPNQRWPTLGELLDELERLRSHRVSRRAALVGGGVVALAGGAIAYAVYDRTPPSPDTAAPPPAAPPQPAPTTLVSPLTKLGGCSFSPTFVNDKTVAFDLTRDGAVDLYTLELGQPPVRRTETPGWEWTASPGPNSHSVLFMVQGTAQEPGIEQLDLVTNARTRVYEGSGWAAWAAGALYVTPGGTNQIRRIRDGNNEVIGDLGDAGNAVMVVASPDGRRLAMVAYRKQSPANLCIVELETSAVRCPLAIDKLARPMRPRLVRPAFSAASDALYYDGSGGTYRVPLAGGEPTLALPQHGYGGIAIAPDGQTMVLSQCRSTSRIVPLPEDATHKELADAAATSPALGKGGTLAYVRQQTTLVVRDADGAQRDLVVRTRGAISELAFSPDGQAIAYQVNDPDDGGIYLVALKAAPPSRLTDNPQDAGPVVTADAVYFTRSATEGTSQLMRIGIDGTREMVVYKKPRIAIGADPRGRVLTISPARDHLYWWDPITGREQPGPALTTDKTANVIETSPDGSWLVALVGGSGRRVVRIRTDGSTKVPELIRQLPDDQGASGAAIDDSGHPWIALTSHVGELWAANAAAGTRW